MKQIITCLVATFLLIACSSKKGRETSIEVLNKETLYIKK